MGASDERGTPVGVRAHLDDPLALGTPRPQAQVDLVKGLGCGVKGLGFRVWGSGLRLPTSGFRVQGSEFRVQGSGFRV